MKHESIVPATLRTSYQHNTLIVTAIKKQNDTEAQSAKIVTSVIIVVEFYSPKKVCGAYTTFNYIILWKMIIFSI